MSMVKKLSSFPLILLLLAGTLISCSPQHAQNDGAFSAYDQFRTGGSLPGESADGEAVPYLTTDPRIDRARLSMVRDPEHPTMAEQRNLEFAQSVKSVRFKTTNAPGGRGPTITVNPTHFEMTMMIEHRPGQVNEYRFNGLLPVSGGQRNVAFTVSENDRSYAVSGQCSNRDCQNELEVRLIKTCNTMGRTTECGAVTLFGSIFNSRVTVRPQNRPQAERYSAAAQEAYRTLTTNLSTTISSSRWGVPGGVSMLEFRLARRSDNAVICTISVPNVPTSTAAVEGNVSSDCALALERVTLTGNSTTGGSFMLATTIQSIDTTQLRPILEISSQYDPGPTTVGLPSLVNNREFMRPANLDYYYSGYVFQNSRERYDEINNENCRLRALAALNAARTEAARGQAQAALARCPARRVDPVVARPARVGGVPISVKIDRDIQRNLRDPAVQRAIQNDLAEWRGAANRFFGYSAIMRPMISAIFNGAGVSPAYFYVQMIETNFWRNERTNRVTRQTEPSFIANVSPTTTSACGVGQIVEDTATNLGMFINRNFSMASTVCTSSTDRYDSTNELTNVDERIYVSAAMCGTARYLRDIIDREYNQPNDDLTLAVTSYHDGPIMENVYTRQQGRVRSCVDRRTTGCAAYSNMEVMEYEADNGSTIRDYRMTVADLFRMGVAFPHGRGYTEQFLAAYQLSLDSTAVGKESWDEDASEVVPPHVFPPSGWASTNWAVCDRILSDPRMMDQRLKGEYRSRSAHTERVRAEQATQRGR